MLSVCSFPPSAGRFQTRIAQVSAASALCVLGLGLPSAATAHLSIIRQGIESAGVYQAQEQTGRALAAGDFNGDGYQDLAIGSPYESVGGQANAGAVVICWGSYYGVTHLGSVLLTAGSEGFSDEADANFGFAVASGDFNHDGYGDLVVGAPGTSFGGASMGQIFVLDGSSTGLFYVLAVQQSDVPGGIDNAGDRFGSSFAVGNFNGDPQGYMDLAVGAPGESGGAGVVYWLLGSVAGIPFGGSGWIMQSSVGETNGAGDNFGFSLAAGNICGSSNDELAVGTPNKSFGGQNGSGRVYIFQGAATGPTTNGWIKFDAQNKDIRQTNGSFGYSLACGKFYTGSYLGLAVGEPGRIENGLSYAGRVVVGKGILAGIDFTGPSGIVLTQDMAGGTINNFDKMGYALASGRFDTDDGFDDVVVGSPGDPVFNTGGAGFVQIFPGRSGGPNGSGWSAFSEGIMGDVNEQGDGLGSSVVVGRFDRSGKGNLAAGSPGKDNAAGEVHVIAPWRQTFFINCKNSVVYDCGNHLIFSQRPFDQVCVASTTKTMTLLIAAERSQLPANDPRHLNLDADYIVPAWVAEGIPGSQVPLITGETMSVRNLIYTMMMLSGNDAAYALADYIYGGGGPWVALPQFVAEMNQRAAQLGMTHTQFANPCGLDGEPVGPDYGEPHSTPEDMAKLARAAMNNPFAAQVAGTVSLPTVRRFPGGINFNWTCNNIFTGVLQNNIQPCNGIKGGSTNCAQACGLFSAAGPFGGNAIACHFQTSFDVSDQSYVPDAANLLKLGLAECGLNLVWNPYDLPFQVYFYGIASTLGMRAGGASEFHGSADAVIDLFRQEGADSASVLLKFGRDSETLVDPERTVDFGVAPFHGHEGIRIRNMGVEPAIVRVQLSYAGLLSFSLQPGEFTDIPAYQSPEPLADFTMSLTNMGARADIAVEELYNFHATIPRGSSPQKFSAVLKRNGMIVEDGLNFVTVGEHRGAGPTLYLAVHAPEATVDVPPGSMPVAGDDALRKITVTPNPFHESAQFRLELARGSSVRLEIFDSSGRSVRSYPASNLPAGPWSAEWDGRSDRGDRMVPGVYFYRVTLDGKEASGGKVILVK